MIARVLAIAAALLTASSATAQGLPSDQTADAYYRDGQTALKRALAVKPNTRRAKNVILFVGDGMGLSTVTASRIWEGQSRGVDGESNSLSFERLPHVALSKTYSHDTQTPDSAATASAMLTGVKTRNGVIGLDGRALREDCASARAARVTTLAELARARGKAAGVVTTVRLTHATPASAYAHVPERDWEDDSEVSAAAKAAGCTDIARQLAEAPLATRMNVAFGGGRARFLPKAAGGEREDGRDLIRAWSQAPRSAYTADAAGLTALKRGGADHVLGLFTPDHMPFVADRAKAGGGIPTLAAMTLKAIDLLSADRDGWFLLVEGGKIDMANHLNNAGRTLPETADFAQAVSAALGVVDLRDTLVIVTADHSHGLVISGYAPRNAPILGIAGDEGRPIKAGDGKAYTTLGYATGPGGPRGEEHRHDPAESDLDDVNYKQAATAYLRSSAHSGEDVPVYAGGPHAYLLEGVFEQNYVFHVIKHAFGF